MSAQPGPLLPWISPGSPERSRPGRAIAGVVGGTVQFTRRPYGDQGHVFGLADLQIVQRRDAADEVALDLAGPYRVSFLIPVSALVLGASLLGEHLEPRHFGGIALIGLRLAASDGYPLRLLRCAPADRGPHPRPSRNRPERGGAACGSAPMHDGPVNRASRRCLVRAGASRNAEGHTATGPNVRLARLAICIQAPGLSG
jgi:hypothetical protein